MSKLTTKKQIAQSFKELLLEKPLPKITINDIAVKASITRQTFYYHFTDIISLVEWITIEDSKKVLEDKTSYETWQEAFLAVFNLIYDDRVFINNIYHNVSHEILSSYLYKLVYPIIYSVIDEKSKGKNIKDDDKIFITNFYKYAFVSIVLEWVDKNMRQDPKIIIEKVSALVKGTIDNCIDNINKN